MSEPSKAVFLSYASQDAEPARRICEVLRGGGIEVWFDQNELRGGDAWDQKIRRQIQDCALFVPIISEHTEQRTEGYFRLEWKLAVDRSYLMADDAAFLVPVAVDSTSELGARVPERFRAVQWTRLPGGAAPPEFGPRLRALLTGAARNARAPVPVPARPSHRGLLMAGIAAALLAAAAVFAWRTMNRLPGVVPAPPRVAATAATVIPEHSIAVLPFADLSERKDQEYISDGLAEDLLNLLSKVPGMQVAARTSAFSFKGSELDVPAIGRRLLVAHVLEGSVHKVGNHLRVTAQLVSTSDNSALWSETYDRELGDVFRLQDEIAAAVVKSLKVSLLGAAPPRSAGTQTPNAYLVFLQGRAKMGTERLADTQEAAADFARVLQLDPNYAPAYVELAEAKLQFAEFDVTDKRKANFYAAMEESKVLLEQALALDPKNAQAYIVRGYLRGYDDRSGAEQDYRRAIKLNPSSARGYNALAQLIYDDPQRRDEALAMVVRARQLDPLDPQYDVLKALLLFHGRGNLKEADALLSDVVAHHPLYQPAWVWLADVRRAGGHYADAIMYDEQALKLDRHSEWPRRILIWNYIDVGDLAAARQVINEAPNPLPIHRIQLLIHDGDWRRAAEVTHAADADDTLTPASEPHGVFALRMEARRTRDFKSAQPLLEKFCNVTWSPKGIPMLPPELGFGYSAVALGDLLIAGGERERGERLLRASLADMDYLARQRGKLWYVQDRATALALLGDRKAALAALHLAVNTGYIDVWELLPVEPAFDPYRGDAEFKAMMAEMQAKMASERQILDRLRASGKVPQRGGAQKVAQDQSQARPR